MPIVIILMLIFLILVLHIGYLTLRNRQLERKNRDNSDQPPDNQHQ